MSFSQVYEAILSNTRFAEASAYRNSSEDADGTALTVRFVRQDPGPMVYGERESFELYRGVVKCMATVHATLGGVVAPVVGTEFKLPRTKNAAAEWGWFVESIQGGGAGWDLTVMLRTKRGAGGKALERGQ